MKLILFDSGYLIFNTIYRIEKKYNIDLNNSNLESDTNKDEQSKSINLTTIISPEKSKKKRLSNELNQIKNIRSNNQTSRRVRNTSWQSAHNAKHF